MAQNTTESTTRAGGPPARSRLFYLDNLRVVLTILVVLHHAAITYGNIPLWFYTEPAQDPSGVLLDVFVIINQTFFMGMFFLIAGYFVPGSVDRRGRRGFVRERLLRLGVPLLVFLVLLRPVAMAPIYGQLLASDPDVPLWWWYLLTFDPGPLWFVEVLLVMSLVYVLVRRAREPDAIATAAAAPSVGTRSDRGRLRWLLPVVAFTLGLAVVTFCWRWAFPAPYWPVVGLPSPGFLPQYVALFAVGVFAYRGDWPNRLPGRSGLVGAVTALAALPVMRAFGTTTPGSGAALGQVLAEGFFATGVILALLVFFRRFVTGQGGLWRFLSTNAYAVYVLHTLVLVGLGVVLSGWEGTAVAKFVVLAVLAVPSTWLLAAFVRALPGAKRVL